MRCWAEPAALIHGLGRGNFPGATNGGSPKEYSLNRCAPKSKIFHLTSFSMSSSNYRELSCPVGGGGTMLGETTPTRIETFHHRWLILDKTQTVPVKILNPYPANPTTTEPHKSLTCLLYFISLWPVSIVFCFSFYECKGLCWSGNIPSYGKWGFGLLSTRSQALG